MSKHALQNTHNDCYQWLSNSSRVHQIQFRPGASPRATLGELTALPNWFKGLTSKGRGRKGTGSGRGGTGNGGIEGVRRDARERGGEGGRRGGGGKNIPSVNSCLRPDFYSSKTQNFSFLVTISTYDHFLPFFLPILSSITRASGADHHRARYLAEQLLTFS